MTALRDVWITTEDGDVIRADAIAGFHLKLVGPTREPGPDDRAVDVELWLTIAHVDHPIRLVSEAVEVVPILLAQLFTALSDAHDADVPLLFLRPVPPIASEDEIGSCWAIEPVAPTARWRDFILG